MIHKRGERRLMRTRGRMVLSYPDPSIGSGESKGVCFQRLGCQDKGAVVSVHD